MDLFAHLEAYVAVAEEGGFSAAAERLGIAQPLLSRRIKNLEEYLGGALFDRSRRRIANTELATLLLPHATDVLGRAEHLRTLARTALTGRTPVLGMPPDCAPAALARVLRAGADREDPLTIRELPAPQRETELAEGGLAFALLRVPPQRSRMRVPLGLGTAQPLPRPVHLDQLRPRRASTERAPRILLTPEDAGGFAVERLRKAVAQAGLAEQCVHAGDSTSTAVAEALAGNGLLLCPEAFARTHGLDWSPLADPALHRGYTLTAAHGSRAPGWLGPLLATVIGAVGETGAPQQEEPADRAHLAARG